MFMVRVWLIASSYFIVKPNDLQSALQRTGLAPLYLVIGDEDYFRDQAIALIRTRAAQGVPDSDQPPPDDSPDSAFSCEILYGDETDAQDVLSRVEAVSFFSNHTLIILKWAEKLSARDGEALIPYVQSPNPTATLVLTATKLDGRLKWVQAVKKQAVVVECSPLYENHRLSWVQKEAVRLGIRLDGEAAQLLKDCSGEGLYSARRELDKLVSYMAPGQTATSDDIQAIQGREVGVSVFELAGAIAKGSYGDALFIVEKNLEAGEAPLRLLGALIWQYRGLWKAKDGLLRGLPESLAAREAGIPPFRQQAFFRLVKAFPISHFRRAFELFTEVDKALKGGSAGMPRRILTNLLVELCQHTIKPITGRDKGQVPGRPLLLRGRSGVDGGG